MRVGLGVYLTALRATAAAPTGPWTPADLGASLALWLDADDASTITLNGSTVSQWDDKSGNSRHASQAVAASQPTYTAAGLNSKPALVFDGVNDSIISPTASSVFPSTITYALAMIPLSTATIRGILTFAGADTFTEPFILQQQATELEQKYYVDGDYRITETIAQNTPYITELSYTGTQWVSWLNGTQGTAYTGPRGSYAGSGIHFGNGFSGPWNGVIGEFVATTTALSTANRQRIEGYLAWKWGLEEDLPIDHPYRFDGSLFGYGLAPNAADYGAGATTAYSLRYVSNSYSGPVVRVREDSGNTEQDFTPTQITDGTLATFVGAGNNGFVTTWYDQSGNGKNATQTTAVSQPKIVNAGALITENGKPAIVFDGVNDSLITNGYIVELSQNSASVFSAGKFSGSYDLVESDVSTPYSSNFILSGPTNGTEVLWVNATRFGIKDAVNQSSMGFIYNGVNFQAYFNGATSGAAGPATVNPEVGNTTVIGASADFATNFSTSTLQEIIIYRSDESANRSAIELNINQHYGIY